MRAVAIAVAVTLGGCLDAGLSRCPTSGRICGEGFVCDDARDRCVGGIDGASCGDLSISGVEQCDDGNLRSHDGCSSTCQIETPVWRLLDPGSGPRIDVSLVYDVLHGRVISFGGSAQPITSAWDGTAWTTVSSATSPPARSDAGFAYSAGARKAVLFGGLDMTLTGRLGDTWLWDGQDWEELAPGGSSPSVRNGHAMVSDGAHVTLFGGAEALDVKGDTWEWDGVWIEVSGQPNDPLPRTGHAFAAMPTNLVMFGGDALGPSNDTYVRDGGVWGPVVLASVPPRFSHAMAPSEDGRVVMYGGTLDNVTLYEDTWQWIGSGWQPLTVAGPGPRFRHEMVLDPIHHYTLLVGGSDNASPPFGDTWGFRLENAATPEESCVAGEDADLDGAVGCDDPDCWARCTPFCAPGAACDPASPRCGDGSCNPDLEAASCPEDCP